MERRSEPRFTLDEAVPIRILGESELTIEGRLVDFSGRGMRVLVDRALAVDTPVRIDLDDQILLGEVCYSQPDGKGRYALGLEMHQSLKHVEDLSRLMRALIDDAVAPAASRQPASHRPAA